MMEETEYAFLRSRGLRVVLHDGKGIIGFPRLFARINVLTPLRFQQDANIELQLMAVDGKQIDYRFKIQSDGREAATGEFKVACCRFPVNADPYAILTPDFVLAKLAD